MSNGGFIQWGDLASSPSACLPAPSSLPSNSSSSWGKWRCLRIAHAARWPVQQSSQPVYMSPHPSPQTPAQHEGNGDVQPGDLSRSPPSLSTCPSACFSPSYSAWGREMSNGGFIQRNDLSSSEPSLSTCPLSMLIALLLGMREMEISKDSQVTCPAVHSCLPVQCPLSLPLTLLPSLREQQGTFLNPPFLLTAA